MSSSQIVVSLADVFADDENNHRIHPHTEDDIINTSNSIYAMGGLLQPIGIKKADPLNTKHKLPYELVFGFGRYKALNHLAESRQQPEWITDVPALLVDPKEVNTEIAQLVENVRRKSITQMELGRKAKKILEMDKSMTQNALADALGEPKSSLSNLLNVMKLPEPVLDLIENYESTGGKEGLSFSHAKLLTGLKGVEEQTLIETARLGATMNYNEFDTHIKKNFKDGSEASTDETTTEASSPESQKSVSTGISAKVVKEKYLPKLTQDFSSVTDPKAKAALALRIDTLKFIQGEPGTQMAAELDAWEKQLVAEKEASKVKDAQESAKKAYIRTSVQRIRAALKELPPELNADGTPNTDRRLKTLPEVLSGVKNAVLASIEKGKAEGKGDNYMSEGFPIANADELMTEIGKYYSEKEAEAQKHAAEKAAEKAKKEAEEAKAATPAPASAPTPQTKPAGKKATAKTKA